MFLCSNMRLLREIHGKTVEDVAEATGSDKATVSRIERGLVANPSAAYISRFCEAFFVEERLLQSGPLRIPVQIAEP